MIEREVSQTTDLEQKLHDILPTEVPNLNTFFTLLKRKAADLDDFLLSNGYVEHSFQVLSEALLSLEENIRNGFEATDLELAIDTDSRIPDIMKKKVKLVILATLPKKD